MYRNPLTANPPDVLSDEANCTRVREAALVGDRQREDFDRYVPYVDYVPGRDI